jgi:hypothetical protein
VFEWEGIITDLSLNHDSLDSFAAVLRAMPEEVRERFDRAVALPADLLPGRTIVPKFSALLALDVNLFWVALHRAAFPGKHQ